MERARVDLGIDSLSKFEAIGKEGTILRATPTSSKITWSGFAVSHASHVYRDKVKREAHFHPQLFLSFVISDSTPSARATHPESNAADIH